MARRRSRYATPTRRAGSPFLAGTTGGPAMRRGRGHGHGHGGGGGGGGGLARRIGVIGAVVIVVAAAVAGVVLWRRHVDAAHARRAAAQRFFKAWAADDLNAMWQALTPDARAKHPRAAFVASYRHAEQAATQRAVRVGKPAGEHGGAIAAPVRVRTNHFGVLAGAVALPVSGKGSSAGVDWDPSLRLPGLRKGEAVHRRSGTPPARGAILAADGTRLDAIPLGASIAGHPPPHATGLEAAFNARLGGHAAERLLFGKRVVATTGVVRGRSVRTTLRPKLIAAAATALGAKLGGVAVLRPRDGAVIGLAGLAVSAPQPPGSTFKMVTVSAALENHIATPSTTFPVATGATLSGVKLGNANGESCGGTLTQAFIVSCNSVFAPLGAKLGAKRLVATARAFGFGEQPPVPLAKPSTISPPSGLKDDLAVGAAAIGQDRDLATPLEMADVAATIATGGRRARPRITQLTPVVRRRVISTKVAHQVRAMMIGVVRSGTGTAAAVPGVQVAGKTGTAELRPNSKDPKDADAWFAAFAPAANPRVAVAVMLVGAGFGGSTAAPIAKRVLEAALSG